MTIIILWLMVVFATAHSFQSSPPSLKSLVLQDLELSPKNWYDRSNEIMFTKRMFIKKQLIFLEISRVPILFDLNVLQIYHFIT